MDMLFSLFIFFFFKQKTSYELRISDWSSDVCSSDLIGDTAENTIARDVTGPVVDRLEAIDIEHHQRQRLREPLGVTQRLLDQDLVGMTAGQPGELIRGRHRFQPPLETVDRQPGRKQHKTGGRKSVV